MSAIRMTAKEYQRQFGGVAGVQTLKEAEQAAMSKPQIRLPKPRTPNKTESNWLLQCKSRHPDCVILYEPFTLNLPSGCRYTPDVVCITKEGGMIYAIYEVKGAHIHNQRSIHAFKEARSAFPWWPFRFAQLRKGLWAVA